jgi:hypothetical protein
MTALLLEVMDVPIFHFSSSLTFSSKLGLCTVRKYAMRYSLLTNYTHGSHASIM